MKQDTQTICRAPGCTLSSDCALYRAEPIIGRVVYMHPMHTVEHCRYYEQRPRAWGVGPESFEDD